MVHIEIVVMQKEQVLLRYWWSLQKHFYGICETWTDYGVWYLFWAWGFRYWGSLIYSIKSILYGVSLTAKAREK